MRKSLYNHRTRIVAFLLIALAIPLSSTVGMAKSLVTRPHVLSRPVGIQATSNVDVFGEILASGKVVVVGGLSLLGKEGQITYVISVLQIQDKALVGWSFVLPRYHASRSDIIRIDTNKGRMKKSPLPNTMVYFVGTADPALTQVDASKDTLLHVARFVMQFISDEGPPKGIDW